MKESSLWVLTVLAVLSSSAAQDCPNPDPVTHVVFLSHPSDCTKFYKCSNGNPILLDCPSGLHFSPDSNVCDRPESANCHSTNDKQCEFSAQFTPHPTDCTKYYACSNGDLIEEDCPDGLYFNPTLNVCDREQGANCVIGCEKLDDDPYGVWSPSSCSSGVNDVDSACSLQCQNGYVLSGNALTYCTANGWNSSNGNLIPKCVLSETQQQQCAFSTQYVPHPTDCTKFYSCSNGDLIEQDCPGDLHFNPTLNVCDWQDDANCVIGCEKLEDDPNGVWSPSSCSSGVNDLDSACSLQCQNGYVLKGSAYTYCTENGWNSSNGNLIPKCVPEECIGEDIENELNKTLSVDASLLFVLDESGSVGTKNFQITKDFVKDIIEAFPLSATRSSGVVTFASATYNPIPLRVSNTDDFMRRVDAIPYRTGGTDILAALQTALSVIKSQAIHPLTLVFLITDGESQTDGTPAANEIKAANYPLFTIGIGSTMLEHLEDLSSQGENNIKHFFHLKNYEVLKSIGEYLNPSKGDSGSGGGVQCP